MNNLIIKQEKDQNKEDIQMQTKPMKGCSVSCIIMEWKLKQGDASINPFKCLKFNTLTTSKAGQELEQQKFLFIDTKRCSHIGRQFASFL